MNIVFCFIDGGEDQEEFVKGKLMELHYAHPTITGAQVNFCSEDQPGQSKTCQIDLTAYGQPFRISETGASFREAAARAVKALTEKIESHAGKVAGN
ncbi:MAG TPA: HPF/RaiA family ribosome-associated protein [Puia sp.]|nr:HPF/RaiA family ribosome-associated protein [Puia sp.]